MYTDINKNAFIILKNLFKHAKQRITVTINTNLLLKYVHQVCNASMLLQVRPCFELTPYTVHVDQGNGHISSTRSNFIKQLCDPAPVPHVATQQTVCMLHGEIFCWGEQQTVSPRSIQTVCWVRKICHSTNVDLIE